MLKKGLALWLITCLLLTALPLGVLGVDEIQIETTGFPTDWVNQNQNVTITPVNDKDNIQSVTVNGNAVSSVSGNPYYMVKQIAFDATNNVLTFGVFMGNTTAAGGQFAFSYNTAQLVPYGNADMQSFFTAYTAADAALFGITKNAPTHSPVLIKTLPGETKAGGMHLNAEKGNGYISWYVLDKAGINAFAAEQPILRFAMQLKDGITLADLDQNSVAIPALSDLNKPAMDSAPSVLVQGTAQLGTADGSLLQGVQINNNFYNTDGMYNNFTFQGVTEGNNPFVVKVTDKNGNIQTTTLPVLVDLTTAISAPTFKTSVRRTTLTVSDFGCDAVPSGITYKAEVYQNDTKVDEKISQNGNPVDLTVPAGTTVTVKVIATTGTGVTNSAQTDVFVPYLDLTGPEITVTGNNGGWYNTDVVLTVSAADPSGVAKITVDGVEIANGDTITVSENKTVDIIAYDAEENSTIHQEIVKIDRMAPSVSIDVQNTYGQTNAITVNAQDDLSGIKEILVNGEVIEGNVYQAPANGRYSVTVVDNAGNSTNDTAVVSMVDTTSPAATVTVQNNWGQTNTITVNASDNASGVAQIYVNDILLDGNTYDADQNGNYDVKIFDMAGNSYQTTVTVSMVDNTAPAATVTTPEVWGKTNTVTIDAQDAQSGVKEIRVEGIVIEGNQFTVAENGSYSYTVTDNAGNVFADTFTVQFVDTIVPQITLSPEPQEPCQQYELQITALDFESGVASVLVNNSPAVENGGVYTFIVDQNKEYTITVTDRAGNVATELFTATVIDNQKPVLTVSGVPQNWTNQSVTFTVTADKTVTFEMGTQTVSEATSAEFTVTENGTYTITATDIAGNITEQTIQIDYIDTDLPTANVQAQDTWGQTNTITILAEDTQSGVAQIQVNDTVLNGNVFTATRLGSYTVSVTDNAGNVYQTTVNVGKIDITAPTLQVTEVSDVPAQSYTFTIDVQDNESGVQSVTVNGNPLPGNSFTAIHNGEYVFTVTDMAGNSTSVTRDVNNIDTTAPVVTVTGAPEAWTNQDATITVSVSEAAHITVDGETVAQNATSAKFIATENKGYVIVATDLAGNQTTYNETVSFIDKTAPVLAATAQDSWGQTNVISISAIDLDAGIAQVKVNDLEVTGSSYVVSENGDYTVTAVDRAGNTATQTVTVSKVDTTAPAVQLSVGEDWGRTNTITINAQDTQSGVQTITVNGTPLLSGNTYAVSENGDYSVVVTDAVGNQSAPEVITVSKVDAENPVISTNDVPGEFTQSHDFVILATDALSGIDKVFVNGTEVQAQDGTYTYTATENGDYTFKAVDKAGNFTEMEKHVSKIDRTAPVFGGEITEGTITNTSVTVNLPVATDNSGEEVTYTLQLDGNPVAYSGAGSHTFSGLAMGSAHTVTYTATDIAGNQSVATKAVRTSGLGSVVVTLNLDGVTGYADMFVTVNNQRKAVESNGTVQFEVLQGNHTVQVEGAGYMTFEKENVSVTSGQTTRVAVSLSQFKAGDINGDSKINIIDLNIAASYYGKTCTTDWMRKADLNRDGRITAQDITMLKNSYNQR